MAKMVIDRQKTDILRLRLRMMLSGFQMMVVGMNSMPGQAFFSLASNSFLRPS